ncbi:MAG: hypothetical protein ACKOWL_00085 [Sphingobacteriaceae bacterium]
MSDIPFSGLGSLVLCIITASIFGILLFCLFIRHILLTCEGKLAQLKTNCVFIGACLFPFVCAALGIVLLIFAEFSSETNVLIDRYISWMALSVSFLMGISYLSLQLKKEKV